MILNYNDDINRKVSYPYTYKSNLINFFFKRWVMTGSLFLAKPRDIYANIAHVYNWCN